MDRLLHIDEIDVLILGQQTRVRFYYGHAAGIALFGIVILVLNNILFSNDNEVAKTAVNITGVFISALSSFPVKEIVNRMDKMDTYRVIKSKIIYFDENRKSMTKADKAQYIETVNRIIEKTIFI